MDTCIVQACQQFTRAVGGVSVDGGLRFGFGGGDDLGVRIDRDMPPVAGKAAGVRFVTVTGLRIHCRDDPIRSDLAGNPEHAVVVGQVLPQHRGQQVRGLRHRLAQRLVLQQSHSAVTRPVSATASSLRIAERIKVMVSIVATAS